MDLAKTIAELRALEEKATPGPVVAHGRAIRIPDGQHGQRDQLIAWCAADAELYAALRNNAIALLSELERLQAVVRDCKVAISICGQHPNLKLKLTDEVTSWQPK